MENLIKSRFVRQFIPFILLIFGGSLALQEFTELRYKYNKVNMLKFRDEIEKEGIKMKKPAEVSLEAEYKKLQKMDLDKWENVRIPRPWDEEEENNENKK